MLKCFFILACFMVLKETNGQLSVTKAVKGYVEIEIYNPDTISKEFINPYFLGVSRLKKNTYVFNLFDNKYQFNNDTLFFFFNDTLMTPGLEKYNLGDSIRISQGVKKYDTLNFQERVRVKYGFPKRKYKVLVIHYLLNSFSCPDRNSKCIVVDLGRK